MKKPKKCLLLTCNEPVFTRGLCQQCYNRAYRAVGMHIITWEKLIERGLILKKILKKPNSLMTKKIENITR